MKTPSAGLLLHRGGPADLEVWIAHMGGPFWARKEEGAWSIPKGEHEAHELPLAVAMREFEEEIGVPAPELDYRLLGEFRQSSGKVVTVFTAEFREELTFVSSNTFELEWPPRSGRMKRFPEIDRAAWHPIDRARELLVSGQRPALTALLAQLDDRSH